MSLLLGIETFQKFAVVVGGGGGGGWWWWRWVVWSKGILEFRFGTNLGLRLEAWTKLNNTCKSLVCCWVEGAWCLFLPPVSTLLMVSQQKLIGTIHQAQILYINIYGGGSIISSRFQLATSSSELLENGQ